MHRVVGLLPRYDIPIKGTRVVVIEISNIVGMPAALLLQVRLYVFNLNLGQLELCFFAYELIICFS